MKKLFVICIAVLFFTLQGSSPWEGAAAVAPAGELPEDGYYVATNSFPRNTVVDITNIESGKSTRAIVSNGINSPGLLAVVSRQAAALIGMKDGSVGRIRMVQPADPIAYMRFTETMAAGTPEYDSGDVITEANLTEEALVAEVYEEDTYAPSEPVIETVEAPPSSTSGLGYVMDEPEWGGSGRLQIVDLPGYEVIPFEPSFSEQSAVAAETIPEIEPEEEPAYIAEPEYDESYYTAEAEAAPEYVREPEIVRVPQEIIKPDPVREVQAFVADNSIKKEVVKNVPEKINEKAPINVVKDVPQFLPERALEDIEKDRPVYYAEKPRDEVIKDVSPWSEYIEQPVQIVREPVREIEQPVRLAQEPEKKPEPPASAPAQQIYVPVETAPNPPVSVYGIDPNDIIPGIVRATPERPEIRTPPPAAQTSQNFSVRTISQLDRGQYYVQVAALSADHVEGAIRAIDRNYNPVVYMNGDSMYRILIGPLNQGESAAILARFKSIGYRDAFVRRGS